MKMGCPCISMAHGIANVIYEVMVLFCSEMLYRTFHTCNADGNAVVIMADDIANVVIKGWPYFSLSSGVLDGTLSKISGVWYYQCSYWGMGHWSLYRLTVWFLL